MNRKSLILSFVLSFMFLSSAALAQNEWFSNWLNTDILSNIQISTPATPDTLVSFLQNFGVSKDITVNWGGILYYIIVPMATFAIVLHSIMVEEIIIKGMKLSAFKGLKGWIFILLILGFLFPTGLIGMAAMWLYATAGILVVYGFGALLIMAIVNRFTYMKTGKPFYGLMIGILISALIAMFVPGAGIFIAILGILMAVIGYRRTRRISVLGELPKKTREELDFADNVVYNIKRHLENKPHIRRKVSDAVIRDAKIIASDLIAGRISKKDAKNKIDELKDEINKIEEKSREEFS